MVIRSLTLGVAAALLAACAVGPDFVRPDIDTPAKFARDDAAADARAVDVATGVESTSAQAPSGDTPSSQAPASQADDEFWRSFNDPLLTRLVEDSLAANHDLRLRGGDSSRFSRDASHRQNAQRLALASRRGAEFPAGEL